MSAEIEHRKSTIEDPLRVLCLNYEYPPVGGGGGRMAHRINAGLVARGHSVRVQTAGMRHLPTREIVDGVEVFRAESFRRKEDTCTVPEMAWYLATSFVPALRHARTWRPHVIHAHFAVPTGALALAVSRLTGVPYVLTAHLGDVPGGVPEQTAGLFRVVQPLTVPIWRGAAAITAVSTFVANLGERAYGIRPEIILNGVPLGPAPACVVGAPPRLLLVGRLSVQKNPRLAIQALALMADLPWECEIIGDGPLRDAMERDARQAGLGARVHFRGWLDGAAVAATMAAADALLITSHSEGLPMAAIEALTHGLAIFSTRIDGVADVVADGQNGALADATPEAFARALRDALGEPGRLSAMRRMAAARAARFDLEHSLDRYEQVLRSAARPAPSRGRGVRSSSADT